MRFILSILLLLIIFPTIAQEETPDPYNDCPTIVQSAIDLTLERCETLSENKVCYGHLILEASPRPGVDDFNFNTPGDIVNAIDIQSLRLSAMDVLSGQWGVVMMEIEANSVQSITQGSNNLQIVLFGDVTLEDAAVFMNASPKTRINIRATPSTNAEIIGVVETDQVLVANGRLETNDWIRVLITDESRQLGWVSADVVQLDGELEALQTIPLDIAMSGTLNELALYGPMQAFYFQTGIDDAPCVQAPNSGILLQTPEGVASVSIWMDEVVIQMDNTVFLQAQPNGNLTVNVLAGSAQVQAQGESSTALSGMAINVPLDASLRANDIPSDPQAFNPQDVQGLPLELLNIPVEIPDPVVVSPGIPIAGEWAFSWSVRSLTCPDGTIVPFTSTGERSSITVQAESLRWNNTIYSNIASGIYQTAYTDGNGNLHQDTLQVVSPDYIEGEKILDLVSPVCTLNVPFTLTLVGENR
ncbi:MAG: hypothetical protein Kow00117_05540 [Phototrophicales bacterium]